MPELPEVDAMIPRLLPLVGGSIFGHLFSGGKDYLPENDAKSLPELGQLKTVTRRGKYIVMSFDDGVLLSHNNMSGYWDTDDAPWTFDYVEFDRKSATNDVRISLFFMFSDGSQKTARFHDVRKFGSLKLISTDELLNLDDRLGPDVIETPFSLTRGMILEEKDLERSLQKSRKKTVKEVLMDQEEMAGIGNIYAAESLFRSGIAPDRPPSKITDKEIGLFHLSIKEVILDAIGKNLRYNDYLRVYRQKVCHSCKMNIAAIKIAGRTSYFCPACQV